VDLTDSCFVLWIRMISLHSRICAYGNKDLGFRFHARTSPSRTGHLRNKSTSRPSVILLLHRCNVDLFYSLNPLAVSAIQPQE
jgi:hypothetical protein